MHRSTFAVRRACAVGTTVALVGLTAGLGIMSATAASAAEPIDSTQPVLSEENPAPVDQAETPAPSEAPSDATPETPAPAEEIPVPTDEATAPADEPTGAETTAPAAGTPAPTAAPTPDVTTKAADANVTIDGKAKVGALLTAVVTGFDEDSRYKYSWTDQDGNVLSKTATYRIDPTDVRKTITVTVTGTLPGATDTTSVTSDATAPVTQTPAFLGVDGKPTTAGADADHPLELSTTAGDVFSHTFRAQGSPVPTYKLDWFFPEDADDATYYDEDGNELPSSPANQLPDGVTFDASTGELSGTATLASDWTFAITATSGTESVTQYVDLTVEAAAPLGLLVFTTDRAGAFEYPGDDTRTRTTWIIDVDGNVYTNIVTGDGEGGYTGTGIEGGRPTIKQGGTLVVSGNLVDQYGNEITDDNDELITPTVTSDVASDVIAPEPELDIPSLVNVTFPHASIHNLSVSAGDFTTSFAVDVQPTAIATVVTPTTPVAAAPVTPTNTGGQLAYTGSNATGALPWALGLLVAGAGLIGARTLRRRRAQR